MMKRIVTETKRPFHIRQLADGFIKDKMGSAEFVSLHWRYDKSDWFKAWVRSSQHNIVLARQMPVVHDQKCILPM